MQPGALWAVRDGVHRDAVFIDEFGAAARLAATTRAGRDLLALPSGQPDVNHGTLSFPTDNDVRSWLLNRCTSATRAVPRCKPAQRGDRGHCPFPPRTSVAGIGTRDKRDALVLVYLAVQWKPVGARAQLPVHK